MTSTEIRPVTSTERYRILDRIGAGGLGVVYKVEDRVSGRFLAMKVMPRDRGIANLRAEFLALARLRHDNIVSVSDYGLTDTGDDYFTMEYVEGPALMEVVDDAPSAPFYQIISGVLRALAFIHARGMVHADLKPSNILIDGKVLSDDPCRAARLVDFGLAAHLDDPDSSAARGTFPYAAPEVYAGRLDARSDLYSVGVILYEMLTGVQAYTGRNVREVLLAQRRVPPEDPRTIRPDLPAPLAELVCALLDPAPGARPQTSDEVLGIINQIAGTDFAIMGSQPLVDLGGGLLIGREAEMATLQRCWRDAQDGQGTAILMCGEEGIGKTRLMAELKLHVQLSGGQAFAAEVAARRESPYAGIARLVKGLLASSRTGIGAMAEWQRTLAPLLGGRVEASQVDHSSRFALAEAVAGVISQLAADQPLLLLIDDVHMADRATIELLSYLVRSVPDSPVLMLMAARQSRLSDEETPQTALDLRVARIYAALAYAERGQGLDLTLLDRASVIRLAEQAFGADIAKKLGDDLYRVSGGNPAHVTRAMELLLQNGAIGRERGAWILRSDSVVIPLPADVRVSAMTRLAQLPKHARRILLTASVLGESFTRDVLTALIARDDETEPGLGVETGVDPALAEAVRARLVLGDATTGSFKFTHRRVASMLYREIPEAERAALHRRAAAILEEQRRRNRNVPPGALAHHYFAIGDYPLAIEWGLKAAEDHSQSYDHHGAMSWYHRLRHIVTGEMAAYVDTRLADLYAILGKIDEACTSYQRAYDARADDPESHIRLARKLGDALRRRGDNDAALKLLMDALREAREHKLTAEEAECHLSIGWALAYRTDYAAAMEHAVAGHLIGRSLNDRGLSSKLTRLRGAIAIFQGDAKTALIHLEAALEDAESTRDDALIANVLLEIGRASIHTGDYVRAINALEKAIESTERIGHIELAARCYNNLGVACYYQGDWERTRTSLERFRRLCDRFDEQSELVNALNNLGSLYRELGQFNEALVALDRGLQVASTIGQKRMAAMLEANRGETLFRRGDLTGARECYERALSEFQRIGSPDDIIETRRRLCELDIAAGKLDSALDRAIDAARDAKETGSRHEEGILHRVAATALRLQGDYESATWFIERAREILTTLGTRYERAKVDLAAAELAAAQGRLEDAEALLNSAIEAFAMLGARWDLSVARSRKRVLLPPQPTPRSTALHNAARSAANQVGLDLFLDFAQALANVEIERLLEIALDKILEITKFERSFILLVDDEGRPLERLRRVRPGAKGFARDEAEFSGTIVRRVAATAEAMAVSDIAQENELREQKSVVALGLRQIMCAPMRTHGRLIGIIYIDSRRLSLEEHGVDLVLLEAFAAQIALAVENSRLIAEGKHKSELLAILAHEVRNPLAGILGYADIGESGEVFDVSLDPKEIFRRIRFDADRLRRLVDNVLELARHERGNTEWSMKPFDIATAINEVMESNRPVCEQKHVTVIMVTDDLHDQAFGNMDRIIQVLANLVNNALKFTPAEGKITITARSEVVAATDPKAPPMPASELRAWLPTEPTDEVVQEFVRVDVSDTGPGMSEDIRSRIFEKFAQASGKRRSSGVGLGLYISREIITRHGGTIWADSELGKGSTFSFRIPIAQ